MSLPRNLVSALALLAVLAVLNPTAKANDVYIAQGTSGSANGSSCTSPYAYTYFNSSGNWTSGTPTGTQIGPGTMVHICGTISVGANTEALIFQGSGTSASPITLYFESGAVMTSPEWPADGTGGAIDIGGYSYITIDGNGGASGKTRGIIQATNNGDSTATCISGTGGGGHCGLHGDSNPLEGNGGNTGITMQGLAITDMYVATGWAIDGVGPNPGGGSCLYVHGKITNWTFTNNIVHDVGWCVSIQYDSGTSSGITISNNNMYNLDHGIALGGPASGNTLQNVFIYGNNIHDYKNWDTTNGYSAQGSWHHDGIHIWGYNNDGSDTIQSVYIYNNTFGGAIGRNDTAHIFIETNGSGTKGNTFYIFNNTLSDTADGYNPDGFLTTGGSSGFNIYNNTFIGSPTGSEVCMGTSSSPSVTFVNNVVSGCVDGLSQGVAGLMYMASGSAAVAGLHNNVYAAGAGSCGSGGQCFNYASSNWFGPFSTWQSDTGQDASPSTYVSNANLNSSGVPQAGSAAIGNGANLTPLCTGQLAALCSDIRGNPRPASGPWDAGAYSTSGSSSGPQPPTGLVAIVN